MATEVSRVPPMAFPREVYSTQGYADVNGLLMYYEQHGAGPPLLMLHAGLSTLELSFGTLAPALAENHRIIAPEMQGHGRTADVRRPLTYEQLAADVVALLRHLRIPQADLLGYSTGAETALRVAIQQPALVRRLVLLSPVYRPDGVYPEARGDEAMAPDSLDNTPFHAAYRAVAPNPSAWHGLVEKWGRLNVGWEGWTDEDLRSLKAPALIVTGDADIVRPEHAVEMLRLLGGGVPGDLHGLPRSRLAVLPGTTHITLAERGEWLAPMIEEFLGAG